MQLLIITNPKTPKPRSPEKLNIIESIIIILEMERNNSFFVLPPIDGTKQLQIEEFNGE